jgi:hypothetical protein
MSSWTSTSAYFSNFVLKLKTSLKCCGITTIISLVAFVPLAKVEESFVRVVEACKWRLTDQFVGNMQVRSHLCQNSGWLSFRSILRLLRHGQDIIQEFKTIYSLVCFSEYMMNSVKIPPNPAAFPTLTNHRVVSRFFYLFVVNRLKSNWQF